MGGEAAGARFSASGEPDARRIVYQTLCLDSKSERSARLAKIHSHVHFGLVVADVINTRIDAPMHKSMSAVRVNNEVAQLLSGEMCPTGRSTRTASLHVASPADFTT
jgi:hypothetical protein